MPYFDSSGRPILLGKVLGQGGEGIVYALANQDEVAVKIYRNPIEDSRQRKIREMVQGCDGALRQIAAWPTDTVHNGGSGGSMCGFTMPSVTGHPVHVLDRLLDFARPADLDVTEPQLGNHAGPQRLHDHVTFTGLDETGFGHGLPWMRGRQGAAEL